MVKCWGYAVVLYCNIIMVVFTWIFGWLISRKDHKVLTAEAQAINAEA